MSRAQRRLAAILAADVVGYSRLMGADEAGTLTALRAMWANQFDPAVALFRGRIVKMMGDGALVEFASAVDAVECAIAIQTGLATGTVTQPALVLRIGVNVGDIVIEGDDIFGDGVNIAARLEAEAPSGGILMSDAVHVQIKGKVDGDFFDLGELALKNIAQPVRAFRWSSGATDVIAPPAPPKPQLPMVAVLPFTNMSGDPEQEYFSDGISEDIITDLSKVSGLMVIARNSSFAYKGKSHDIRQVGRELAASAVLEGSIRRAGNRVRITAQLIDAKNGTHLWAERYDRDLTDIFAVQDEVTLQIVGALKIKLLSAERLSIAQLPTSSVAAHDFMLRGRELCLALLNVPDNPAAMMRQSITAFEQALALDPNYALAYAGLSTVYSLEYQNNWLGLPGALDACKAMATKALELGPNEAQAHLAMALYCFGAGDLKTMKSEAEKARSISPSLYLASEFTGMADLFAGNAQSALPNFKIAMRLDPAQSSTPLHFIGIAHLLTGEHRLAAEALRARIVKVPNTTSSRAILAAVLGHLGEIDTARQVWAELKAIRPDYSFSAHMARLAWQNPGDPARIAEGLALAGISQ